MTESTERTAVLNELAATRASLADTVPAVRRRNLISATLSVLSIIVLAGYLIFGYLTYGRQVTPDLVASVASKDFQEQLPAARVKLEEKLTAQAPQVAQSTFDKIKGLPEQYATQLQKEGTAKMDAAMPEVQDRMYTAMKNAVDQSVAAAGSAGGDDEARMKATLDHVADAYAKDSAAAVTQTHNTYWSDAGLFLDYMDRLATSPNLDRRDRLHKQMFQTVFALIREHSTSATPAGEPAATLTGMKAP